jgi:urea transporter
MFSVSDNAIPDPLRAGFRGIGQVFFQENALTGICFAVGIAVSSPLMALGAVIGAAIGTATARLLKFDAAEVSAGLYGFNSTLVGIATFFFFKPGVVSVALLLVGCIVAALVTRLMRRYVPFPTYTAPFIVTTWVFFFLGLALGVPRTEPGAPFSSISFLGAVANGVSQVMFQASVWTALLFLIGIALSDWQHASWVVIGSVVGVLLATCIANAGTQAVDPESLVERTVFQNMALGLYGYNATLAAIALYLWRRSLIPALLGILLSVPLTEYVPMLGLPALTAPFVLASWIVLGLGWLDGRLFREKLSAST